jgi:hypothetical protein
MPGEDRSKPNTLSIYLEKRRRRRISEEEEEGRRR